MKKYIDEQIEMFKDGLLFKLFVYILKSTKKAYKELLEGKKYRK